MPPLEGAPTNLPKEKGLFPKLSHRAVGDVGRMAEDGRCLHVNAVSAVVLTPKEGSNHFFHSEDLVTTVSPAHATSTANRLAIRSCTSQKHTRSTHQNLSLQSVPLSIYFQLPIESCKDQDRIFRWCVTNVNPWHCL